MTQSVSFKNKQFHDQSFLRLVSTLAWHTRFKKFLDNDYIWKLTEATPHTMTIATLHFSQLSGYLHLLVVELCNQSPIVTNFAQREQIKFPWKQDHDKR